METSTSKWIVRAMGVLALIVCNFLVGCDCGGGNGNGPVAVGGATRYNVVDLGAMRPTGINSRGQIVGVIDGAGFTTQPVIWQSGAMTQLQGLGGNSDGPNAINDNGVIVGHGGGVGLAGPQGPTFHAAIWASSTAVPTLLPAPPGPADLFSDATGINNNGDAVGFGFNLTANPLVSDRAIAWSHGASAGVLLSGIPGADATTAWSINGAGQVVGSTELPGIIQKQILFNLSQPTMPQDLGIDITAATTTHVPSAELPAFINASGTIAGTLKDSVGQAVAYIRLPNGQVTRISTPGGSNDQGESTGINASGTVSLTINPDNVGSTPTAAIFDPAKGFRDLTGLIVPSGSGWQLQRTSGINDSGQIVGVGQFQGSQHGFLLIPVP